MAERVLPGLGLTAYWDIGASGWAVEHDPDTRTLSILCQCRVIAAVSALPGSPSDGDIYIAPPDDPTIPNGIVARDNATWVYYMPQDGFLVYVENVGEYVSWDSAASTWMPVSAAKVFSYSSAASLASGVPCGSRHRLDDVSMTIPNDSVAPYPVGFWFEVEQIGTSASSIVASSTTVNTAKTLTLAGQFSVAKVMKVGSNEWTVSGDLELP